MCVHVFVSARECARVCESVQERKRESEVRKMGKLNGGKNSSFILLQCVQTAQTKITPPPFHFMYMRANRWKHARTHIHTHICANMSTLKVCVCVCACVRVCVCVCVSARATLIHPFCVDGGGENSFKKETLGAAANLAATHPAAYP